MGGARGWKCVCSVVENLPAEHVEGGGNCGVVSEQDCKLMVVLGSLVATCLCTGKKNYLWNLREKART